MKGYHYRRQKTSDENRVTNSVTDTCCLTSTNGNRPGQHRRVPGGSLMLPRAQGTAMSPLPCKSRQLSASVTSALGRSHLPVDPVYSLIRTSDFWERERKRRQTPGLWLPGTPCGRLSEAPVAMTSESAAAPVPSSRSCDSLAGGPFHLHQVLQIAAVDNKLKDLGFFALKRWC